MDSDNKQDAAIAIAAPYLIEWLKSQMGKPTPQKPVENGQSLELNEEQIIDEIEKLTPEQRAAAKNLDDNKIKEFIKSREPRISENSLNKAVQIIKK